MSFLLVLLLVVVLPLSQLFFHFYLYFIVTFMIFYGFLFLSPFLWFRRWFRSWSFSIRVWIWIIRSFSVFLFLLIPSASFPVFWTLITLLTALMISWSRHVLIFSLLFQLLVSLLSPINGSTLLSLSRSIASLVSLISLISRHVVIVSSRGQVSTNHTIKLFVLVSFISLSKLW